MRKATMPKTITFMVSTIGLKKTDYIINDGDCNRFDYDSYVIDIVERIGDLLSDKYGFCHNGFDYDIINYNNSYEPKKIICKNIRWDFS